MTIPPGTILVDRYRVQSHLRRENLGHVFAAEDTRAGQRVAVKVLAQDASEPHAPGGPRGNDAPVRFLQEGRALTQVRSDHIAPVLALEEDPAHGPVIVLELREGECLLDRLKRSGPMSI